MNASSPTRLSNAGAEVLLRQLVPRGVGFELRGADEGSGRRAGAGDPGILRSTAPVPCRRGPSDPTVVPHRLNPASLRLLAVAAPLLALPAFAQAPLPEGDDLAADLRNGVWCNSEDGGATCSAFDEFRPGGVIAACGQFSGDRQPFEAEGTYEVQGRFSCFVVTRASDTFALRPGARFCTESLYIDARIHRYRDVETGEETTQYRRPRAAMTCPSVPV